jgi:Leucine-rich repeat (LRR) protein
MGTWDLVQLSGGQLTHVPAGIFTDAPVVFTEIILSRNKIASIDDNAFAGLPLFKLDLSGNKLTKFDSSAVGYKFANTLDLGSNQLDSFDSVRLQANTTMLYLNGNQFQGKVTSDSFSELSNLETLDLSFNWINEVDLSSLASTMNFLNLHGNPIFSVESASLPASVTKLLLAGNQLSRLDDDFFSRFENLEAVSIADNSLTSFPSSLYKVKNLNKVLASGNMLTALFEDSFVAHKSLNILNFSGNAISEWNDHTLAKLTNLKQLDLSNNKLTMLPKKAFHDLDNLESLDLRNNQIEKLTDDPWPTDNKQRYWLSLAGNPLECLPEQAKEHVIDGLGLPKC